MPGNVIDECRNKYSAFRDRHEAEYVAKKTAEDELVSRETDRGERMRPRGVRNVARRRARTSAGGRFMEVGKVDAKIENRNLEAVGAFMASKGLGAVKMQVLPVRTKPSVLGDVGSQAGMGESAAPP